MQQKIYSPLLSKEEEQKIYQQWLSNNFFEPEINSNKPKFSITLPPPNVTGHLHVGHAWDTIIQDFIIRFKKLCGYNTCFLPGTDHAGISAQAKFEKVLKEKGSNRYDYSDEEFKKLLLAWCKEQQTYIHQQWARLGLALSYKYETFTLDENANGLISKEFKKLYDDKLIYRGLRLTNWDCKQMTAISDIEVIRKETHSKFWTFKYLLENSNEYVEISTTRPETMFVDTNIVVNPNDKRYQKFIGKNFINPVNGDKLKCIADEEIDIEFGTGVMKLTPAHDFLDNKIATRNNIINFNSCINLDGTLNEFAKEFKGLDRIKARTQIVNYIKQKGLLIKEEDIINNVGYSERSGEVVEPLMTKQWFVRMKPLVEKYNKLNNKPKFFPARCEDKLNEWLNNIQDWCISRQLLWGHTIPAYVNEITDEVYVGNTKPDGKGWVKEKDVLDTWFSSGLWPLTTTKYNGHDNGLLKDFYPVSLLVTGYDILFFWVARMLLQCAYIDDTLSLSNIYCHGLIRDENGVKMSKSLGNVIDPIDVLNEYGCDVWRIAILSKTTSEGYDVNFPRQELEYMWAFENKLINGSKYIEMVNENKEIKDIADIKNPVNVLIINECNNLFGEVKKHVENMEINLAIEKTVNFVWETFFNTYLEMAKPFIKVGCNETIIVLNYIFKKILLLLQPSMCFITTKILNESKIDFSKSNITLNHFDEIIVKNGKLIMNIWKEVRDYRIKEGIKNSEKVEINVINLDEKILNFYNIVVNKQIELGNDIYIINRTIKKQVNNEKINRRIEELKKILLNTKLKELKPDIYSKYEEELKSLLNK